MAAPTFSKHHHKMGSQFWVVTKKSSQPTYKIYQNMIFLAISGGICLCLCRTRKTMMPNAPTHTNHHLCVLLGIFRFLCHFRLIACKSPYAIATQVTSKPPGRASNLQSSLVFHHLRTLFTGEDGLLWNFSLPAKITKGTVT